LQRNRIHDPGSKEFGRGQGSGTLFHSARHRATLQSFPGTDRPWPVFELTNVASSRRTLVFATVATFPYGRVRMSNVQSMQGTPISAMQVPRPRWLGQVEVVVITQSSGGENMGEGTGCKSAEWATTDATSKARIPGPGSQKATTTSIIFMRLN
jgi:hypothetical protein